MISSGRKPSSQKWMKENAYQPRKLSVPNKRTNTKSFTNGKCGNHHERRKCPALGKQCGNVTSLDILHQSAGPNPFMPMK